MRKRRKNKTFVFQPLASEIDEEGPGQTGCLQVVDGLGLILHREFAQGFQFDDHRIEAFVGGSSFSNYRDAIAFVILIVILLFRPSGLFGKYEPEKV